MIQVFAVLKVFTAAFSLVVFGSTVSLLLNCLREKGSLVGAAVGIFESIHCHIGSASVGNSSNFASLPSPFVG